MWACFGIVGVVFGVVGGTALVIERPPQVPILQHSLPQTTTGAVARGECPVDSELEVIRTGDGGDHAGSLAAKIGDLEDAQVRDTVSEAGEAVAATKEGVLDVVASTLTGYGHLGRRSRSRTPSTSASTSRTTPGPRRAAGSRSRSGRRPGLCSPRRGRWPRSPRRSPPGR